MRLSKTDLLEIIELTKGQQGCEILYSKATLMLHGGDYEGNKVRRRKVRVQSTTQQTIGRNTEGINVRQEQVQGEQLEESAPSQAVSERCNPSLTRVPFGENA